MVVDEDRKYREQRLLPSLTLRILICGATDPLGLSALVFAGRDWGVPEVSAESGSIKNELTDHKYSYEFYEVY